MEKGMMIKALDSILHNELIDIVDIVMLINKWTITKVEQSEGYGKTYTNVDWALDKLNRAQ